MSLLNSKCWFKKSARNSSYPELKNQNEWARNWIDWNPMERKSKSLDPFTSTVIGIRMRDTESTLVSLLTSSSLVNSLAQWNIVAKLPNQQWETWVDTFSVYMQNTQHYDLNAIMYDTIAWSVSAYYRTLLVIRLTLACDIFRTIW
jgi:hypothetical protein